MRHAKRAGITIAAAACLIVGAAVGGSLLTAGAATSGSSATGRGFNETKAHEAGESAARESAETNGTADHGREGTFTPNEDQGHEASESAEREPAEPNGPAGPGRDGAFTP